MDLKSGRLVNDLSMTIMISGGTAMWLAMILRDWIWAFKRSDCSSVNKDRDVDDAVAAVFAGLEWVLEGVFAAAAWTGWAGVVAAG